MQQQQYRTQRRTKPKLAVSRKYTSSFSGIDWGRSSRPDISADDDDDDEFFVNSLLPDDSFRQEFAKRRSSLGEEEAEESRSTVVSQESSGATSSTTGTTQKSNEKKGGHSPLQNRPSLLTALNSWRGSIRDKFVPRSDDNSANKDDDSMDDDDDTPCTAAKSSLREMFVPLKNELQHQPAALVTRRCSSQLDESDVGDDGFLHWNDTQRSRK